MHPADVVRRVDRRRALGIAAAVVVAACAVQVALNVALGPPPRTFMGTPVLPDFLAHWTGGRLLVEGRADELYDRASQLALQVATVGGDGSRISWFVSPPSAALLYAPFGALSYVAASALWTAVSVVLLLESMLLLRPLLPRLGGRGFGVVTLCVLATYPVLELVGAGQDSALSLFLWVSGLRLLRAERDALAGAVLALGLVKPQLFVLAPVVLLAQRRWRGLAGFAAVAAGLAVASWAVVGTDRMVQWVQIPFTDLYRVNVQEPQAWRMQGLPSLAVAVAPPGWSTAASLAGALVGLAVVALFVRTAWRAPRSAGDQVWALAALTTVAAAPHLLEYDLLLAVPAFLLLLDRHDDRRTRLLLLLVYVLTWTGWVRHLLVTDAPWPITSVGAGWAAIPVALLWWTCWRDAETAVRTSRAAPQTQAALT